MKTTVKIIFSRTFLETIGNTSYYPDYSPCDKTITLEYENPVTVEDYQGMLIDLMRVATFSDDLANDAVGNYEED